MAASMENENHHLCATTSMDMETPTDVSELACVDDGPQIEVRIIGGTKGKGLFALKDFKEGDIIFEEKPLVSCQFLWNATYGYLTCDFCLRPLETTEENVSRLTAKKITLPYPECCETNKETHVVCPHCEVKYCSSECRGSAWEQFHETLCLGISSGDSAHPMQLLQDAWKQMHYPPETANIMLIARTIATVKQAEDKEGAMHLFSQFCHNTVNEEEEIVHKLLGDQFKDQLETLRSLMIKAIYDDNVQQWYTPDGFRSLIALIGMNGQGIGTSPLCVWVKNTEALDLPTEKREKLDSFIDKLYEDIDAESGSFLNNEGSALYALQSSCNHNCVPNVEATFPDNNFNLVMIAMRDIEADEELCVSYLDECNRNRSRHTRVKLLRENYLFTCNCEKCLSEINDPDETSAEEESGEEMDT